MERAAAAGWCSSGRGSRGRLGPGHLPASRAQLNAGRACGEWGRDGADGARELVDVVPVRLLVSALFLEGQNELILCFSHPSADPSWKRVVGGCRVSDELTDHVEAAVGEETGSCLLPSYVPAWLKLCVKPAALRRQSSL